MLAPPPPPDPAAVAPRRCLALDAYRGWVMFLMMAEVLQFCAVAKAKPGNGWWKFLCHQQTHAAWTGCSLHDLIQPSFTFLVGVVLPFSLASRIARGQSRARMTAHAWARALILVLLGVLLRSINAGFIDWTFEDTLSQIGLGYGFLFLLGFRPARDHWIALVVILLGYWTAFALYPAPALELSAHWHKNTNLAWAFDTWFLNLFPRAHPFRHNGGGYATLSFVPTLGTMILGLIAGNIIRDARPPWSKVRWFVVAGIMGLGLGLLADATGICPVVKRIWTPAWTLYSGGWCFLYLAAFYTIIEVLGYQRWAFPLLVIGSNSIAAYCVANIFDGVLERLADHFGWNLAAAPSNPYEPLLNGAIVLLFFWLGLYALYRKKIFLRI